MNPINPLPDDLSHSLIAAISSLNRLSKHCTACSMYEQQTTEYLSKIAKIQEEVFNCQENTQTYLAASPKKSAPLS